MNKNLVSLTALTAGLLTATSASAMIYEEDCKTAANLYFEAGKHCSGNKVGTQECDMAMVDWAIDQDGGGTYYELWESSKLDIFNCIRANTTYTETTFLGCSRDFGWQCHPSGCGQGEYYIESEQKCVLCSPGTYMHLDNHYRTSCFDCPADSEADDKYISSNQGATSVIYCYVNNAEWNFSTPSGSGLRRYYEENSTDCYYGGSF